MRILIAPMAALAEMKGPIRRARALAIEAKKRGHDIAFCAATDPNYLPVEEIKNYPAPLPSPFGLPLFIGKRVFKIAQILGIQQRKRVRSFEEVLHIVGAIDRKFFPKDVYCLRKAIREFRPDVVYSEFRISAIIAAEMEDVNIVTSYSFPIQKTYTCNPEYAGGVKEFLRRNNLPEIESVLDIFDWADLKIVPSSYELEPIDDKKVVYVGPFVVPQKTGKKSIRGGSERVIIAYMGSGTITPKRLVKVLTKTFGGTDFNVYISTRIITPSVRGIMPRATAFINHGGQNSVMTGLIYGTPQIICPGNVFERRYNACSVERLKAGVSIETDDFTPERIRQLIQEFESDPSYRNNARKVGGETSKPRRGFQSRRCSGGKVWCMMA